MDEPRRGTKINIGDSDIYLWTHSNPQIIFPELVIAAEEMLYKGEDEKLALQVENKINKKRRNFDFFVRKEEIDDTLDKALEWAELDEEYEVCQRIKNLQEFINEVEIK